ncbi:MAG: tripartite tricarboxylate transporter permease [Thermodesulfobacteriota bacterium]
MDLFVVGLKTAVQPYYLLMAFLGAFLGVAFGAIPGINAIVGVALLVPLTITLDPIAAFILLGAVYTGGAVGGAFPAILFKIPGAPEAAATTFDGYPLAQKGQAGKAIGMALFASTTGGIFGVLALSFLSPQLAKISLSFSAQEYFAFALLGLTIIMTIGKSLLKALISGLLGLLLATVGIDKMTTAERFTFGFKPIFGGFEFVSIIIGIFAFGEVLKRIQSKEAGKFTTRDKVSTKWPSLIEILECKWTLLRSYFLGTIIGILPGVGATTASFFGYSEAVRFSKHPEKFGTGVLEGVAACESANNAAIGGALVPLLTLGIPGSATTAVMVGGLLIHGMIPGPLLFVEQTRFIYTFFAGMLVAQMTMLICGAIGVRFFVKVLNLPYSIIAPSILVLSVVGAYSMRNDYFDMWVMFVGGIVGYYMNRYDYPLPPLVIGLVLGDLVETSFRRTLILQDYQFMSIFLRPLSGGILILVILAFFYVLFRKYYRERKIRKDKSF